MTHLPAALLPKTRRTSSPSKQARWTSASFPNGRAKERQPRAFLRWLADGSNDQGAAVQAAILFPFLIILTFAIIQGGIWFYARSAALNAAEEGLQAARAENGSTAAAVAASSSFLQRAASGTVRNPSTQVNASPLTISVTVSGESSSIVDFLPLPRISQTVTGAAERFTTN